MAKTKTKIDKVYNLLYSGKKIKLSTIARRLYNSTDSNSLNNARRIVNHLKNEHDVKVELADKGIYQIK